MIIGSDGSEKRYIQKKSRKQEDRTASAYKGSRNAGSGSGWLRKNDVRSEDFLIENKFTDNLKFTDLRDLETVAIKEDRTPVLQFDLGGKRYIILREDDFLEMINE